MIIRLENERPPTIRPGMWLKDRDGKRWQWCAAGAAGVLTDGLGQILCLGGCERLWYLGELTDAIKRGDLTPEADSATVEVQTLPLNTVIQWGDHCWQIVHKTWSGVRMRPWPNLRGGVEDSTTIHRTTPVTTIGVPVVEEKP